MLLMLLTGILYARSPNTCLIAIVSVESFSPGQVLRYHAVADTIHDAGASVTGRVESGDGGHVADISLMFSHIDRNMAGLAFPEHNFVFNASFRQLLETFRADVRTDL